MHKSDMSCAESSHANVPKPSSETSPPLPAAGSAEPFRSISAVLCKKPASEPLLNATELHVRLSAAENAAGLYEDHAQPAERTAEDSSAG